MYNTREEAEEKIKELVELRAKYGKPPVKRKVIKKWGKFEIIVVKACSRCGAEVESRGATSLILCQSCWRKKEAEDTAAATAAAERAKAQMAAYDDFEEICQ